VESNTKHILVNGVRIQSCFVSSSLGDLLRGNKENGEHIESEKSRVENKGKSNAQQDRVVPSVFIRRCFNTGPFSLADTFAITPFLGIDLEQTRNYGNKKKENKKAHRRTKMFILASSSVPFFTIP